ncbi:hypothetical protein EVAR_70394_1 [Eumeta japonica]|uniref:Uncharacterized protein n=1 Tax=Eumeta variegata TaxID=151549 RepID=A0A4C1SRS3_EUMVA|nr:hypothetical protein EVAR_70394_1 [Eumeta japonica]
MQTILFNKLQPVYVTRSRTHGPHPTRPSPLRGAGCRSPVAGCPNNVPELLFRYRNILLFRDLSSLPPHESCDGAHAPRVVVANKNKIVHRLFDDER